MTIRRLTASELRTDIYRILDQVLHSGIPVEIERRGQILRIVPPQQQAKLDRLKGDPAYIRVDPEDLVHIDWSEEWKP